MWGIIKAGKVQGPGGAGANVILDLDDLLDVIVRTVRKYYPDAQLTEVRVGRGRLRIYGRAGRIWFKVVTTPRGTRVYSNSRTLEFALKKRLERA